MAKGEDDMLWIQIKLSLGFSGGSVVNNLLATQETRQEPWVWSLGQEDTLEEQMATHSSILVWEILWTEVPGGLQSMESQRVRHNLVTEHAKLSLKSSFDNI